MDDDLDALAEELAEFAVPEKKGGRTAREERVIAGFEDIQRFVDEHGRVPRDGGDIFERMYAVRLRRLRGLTEWHGVLGPLDRQRLLSGEEEEIDTDALLAELEGDAGGMRHVRSAAERRAAENIAERKPCVEFEPFARLFETVRRDLASGVRESRPFGRQSAAEVNEGEFFVLGGQIAYVAQLRDAMRTPNGEADARLRVIFDNGTESDLLLRSLQRALYKDEGGRRISEPVAGPLFARRG